MMLTLTMVTLTMLTLTMVMLTMVTWTMMDLHLRIAIISKRKGPTMMFAIRADPSLETQVLSQIRPYKESPTKRDFLSFRAGLDDKQCP